MNRLTTIGIFLVVLLLPTTRAVAQRVGGPPIRLSPPGVQRPPADVPVPKPVAQTPTSPWTVTTATDPLTDKKMLTASCGAANGEHPTLEYQLELKCASGSSPEVHIATFDLTNTAVGEHAARTIPWTNNADAINKVRRENAVMRARLTTTNALEDAITASLFMKNEEELTWSQSFSYRIDSASVQSAHLRQTYANSGSVPVPMSTLPTTRFVVADLFPGETIVFPFNSLTPEQRTTMQTMCFPSAPTPAPAPDSPHGTDADKCRSLSGMPYYVCMHPVVPTPTATSPAPDGSYRDPIRGLQYAPRPLTPSASSTASGIWKQVDGSTSARVRQLLGAPYTTIDTSGVTTWYYNTPSGAVRVYFVNGKDVASLDPPMK